MITTPSTVNEYREKYEEPEHHTRALLDASIFTLELSARIIIPLWNAGVKTVGQLLSTRQQWRTFPQIGVESVTTINRQLAIMGL